MSLPTPLQPFVVDRPRENWSSFGDPKSPHLRVLRFADRAEQEAAFAAAGIAAPEGLDLSADFFWPDLGDISVLGRVVDQQAVPGEPDEDGLPTIAREATYLPGWYVNILLAELAASEAEPAPVTIAACQAAIDRHVDTVARERNYSSGVSLASYASSTVPLWRAEAEAFIAWRDAVWAYALAELASVQSGDRAAPDTVEAFVEELPAIVWPAA